MVLSAGSVRAVGTTRRFAPDMLQGPLVSPRSSCPCVLLEAGAPRESAGAHLEGTSADEVPLGVAAAAALTRMNLGPPERAPSLAVVTTSSRPLLLPSSAVGYHLRQQQDAGSGLGDSAAWAHKQALL